MLKMRGHNGSWGIHLSSLLITEELYVLVSSTVEYLKQPAPKEEVGLLKLLEVQSPYNFQSLVSVPERW